MIKTNIPDQTPIPFTKKLLHNPNNPKFDNSKYSEYPYVTKLIKYPYDVLSKLEYSELTDFFFIEKKFKNRLNNIKTETPDTKESKIERENKILEHNIITMLELLFPTYYPTYNNFFISFKENIGGTEIEIPTKSTFNKNAKFSYIKLNSNDIYTISKITLLNDFINHPTYGDFINEFYEYQKWVDVIIPTIQDKITNTNQTISNLIKTYNNIDSEIANLKNYLSNLDTPSSTYTTGDSTERKISINNIIKSLEIINLFKEYISDKPPNEAKFLTYAKYISFSKTGGFKKDDLIEYNPDPDNNKWWYPAVIVSESNNKKKYDKTYDIIMLTYDLKNIRDIRDVDISKIRPFTIKETPIDEEVDYYEYIEPDKKEQNANFLSLSEIISNGITITKTPIKKIKQLVNLKTNGLETLVLVETENGPVNIYLSHIRTKYKIIDEHNTPEKYLADTLYKLKESYEKSKSYYTNYSAKFKTFMQKLLELNDSSIKITTFKENYLDKENSYLKFEIDPNYKVDEEFEIFTNISKTIKNLSSIITTNQTLQELINDYANNSKNYEVIIDKKEKHLFYEFIQYMINCYLLNSNCNDKSLLEVYKSLPNNSKINKFEEMLNNKTLFKTNVKINTDKKLPSYEIYITADLLKDEITKANVNKIKCAYEDYNAAYKLENYIDNVKLNPYIVEQGPLILPDKNENPQKDTNQPIKNGGRTKRKHNKNKSKRSTRKNK
jgi:hypothetical protein